MSNDLKHVPHVLLANEIFLKIQTYKYRDVSLGCSHFSAVSCARVEAARSDEAYQDVTAQKLSRTRGTCMSRWHAVLGRSRTALLVTSRDEDDALHERTRNAATHVAHAYAAVCNARTYENGVTNVHTRESCISRVHACVTLLHATRRVRTVRNRGNDVCACPRAYTRLQCKSP